MNQSEKWKKTIVTGGWVSPPHEKINGVNYITDEQYATVRDAGINYLFSMYEDPRSYGDEKIMQAMTLADKYNVGMLVADYRFCDDKITPDEIRALLNKYKAHPSFVGLNLFDEPGAARFPVLQAQQACIKAVDSDCLCFVNLLPMYALSTILKGTYKEGDTEPSTDEEYVQYLDAFMRDYRSELLSYDFYPFHHPFSLTYGAYDTNYFKQMYLVRERAAKCGIPFWTFIQLTAWNPDVPLLTREQIFWQIHTSIAGGAAGLMYFTYWTPESSDVESYRGALISRDGKRGHSYSDVREINSFVAHIGEKVRSAKYRGLVVPPSLAEIIPPEAYAQLPKGVTVHGDDILVGVYGDDAHALLYAVNTSLTAERTVEITFDTEQTIRTYAVSGDSKTKDDRYAVKLSEGDGVLIEIER